MRLIKKNVTLRESDHVYLDEDGIQYTSATTILGKHKPKFDSNFWSHYKAVERIIVKQSGWDYWNDCKRQFNKNAGTVLEASEGLDKSIVEDTRKIILKEWKDKTDSANERGTATHDGLEHGVLGVNEETRKEFNKKYLKDLNKLKSNYPSIYKGIMTYIDAGYKAVPEKIVYWNPALVAGMIDLLLYRGKSFYIMDWKTNKRVMQFKAGYWVKKNDIETGEYKLTNDKMDAPFNHLPDCPGTHYALQLSLYAYIMELWGFKCEKLVLCHIEDNDKDRIKWYSMPYYRKEIADLFNEQILKVA